MKRLVAGLLALASLAVAPVASATNMIVHGKWVMIPIPRFLLPPSDALPDGVMYANPVDRRDDHRPRWRAEGWRDARVDRRAERRDWRDDARRDDRPGGGPGDAGRDRGAEQDYAPEPRDYDRRRDDDHPRYRDDQGRWEDDRGQPPYDDDGDDRDRR